MEENDNTILSKNTKILFNFIQIRLFDLSQVLQVGGHKLSINQIKQALQKQYNIFGQIEKIFNQLKINKLYDLLKQVSQNYISIASILIDLKNKDQNSFSNYRQSNTNSPSKLQSQHATGEKTLDKNINLQIQFNKKKSLVKTQQTSKLQEQIDKDFENIKVHQFELQNKLGGIHLFNENYKRGIETLEQKQQSWEQKKRKKYGQKQLILQLISKEISHQVDVEKLHDNDEISKFIREGKIKNQIYNHIEYEKDLQSISTFLKQSQEDALKFLTQTKKVKQAQNSKENDDEIVVHYHELVEMLVERKKIQYKAVESKIKQIVEAFKNKFDKMEHDLQIKEANIRELEFKLKKKQTHQVSSQTVGLMNRFNLKNSQGAIQQLEQQHKTVVQLLKKNLDEYQKDILSLQANVKINDEKLKKKQQQVNDLTIQIQKLKKMFKQQKQNLLASRIIESNPKNVEQKQNSIDLLKGVVKVQQKKQKQLQQVKVSGHKKKKQKYSYFGISNNNLSLNSKLVKNVESEILTPQIETLQNDEKFKSNISSWMSSKNQTKRELLEDDIGYNIEEYVKQKYVTQNLESKNIIIPNNYQRNNISQRQKQDANFSDNQNLVKEKTDHNSQQKIIEEQKVRKRSQQIQKTDVINSQQNTQEIKALDTNNSKNQSYSNNQNQLSQVKRYERKSNEEKNQERKSNQIKTDERKSYEGKKKFNSGMKKAESRVEKQISFVKKIQESQNGKFGSSGSTTINTPVNNQQKKSVQNQSRILENNSSPIIDNKGDQKTIQKEDVTDMNDMAQSRNQRKLLQNNTIKVYQLLFKSISEMEYQFYGPNQLSKFIQKYNQEELYMRLKRIFGVLKAYSNYKNQIQPIIEKEYGEQEDIIYSDKIPQNIKFPNLNQDNLKENSQRNNKRLTFRDIKTNSDAEKYEKQQTMKLQKTKKIKNLTKKFTSGLYQKIHHQIRIIGKGLGVSKNQFIQICQKINLQESLPNSSESSDSQSHKQQRNSSLTKNQSNFQRVKSSKNIKQKQIRLTTQLDKEQGTELKIKDKKEANKQQDKSKRVLNNFSGHKKKQSKSMRNLINHENLPQKTETQKLIKIEKLQTISHLASDSDESEPENINQTIKRYYNKEEIKNEKKKQIQNFYKVLKNQGTKIQSINKLEEIIEANQISLKEIIKIKALIENQKLANTSKVLTKDCDHFCKNLNKSAGNSPKSCCNHIKKYQLFLERLSLNQQSLRRIRKQVFSMNILTIDGNQDTHGNIDKSQLPNTKSNTKMNLTSNNSDAVLKALQTQKIYSSSKRNDEIMMGRQTLKKTALSTHFESKQRRLNYFETKNRPKNADSISFLPQLGNKFASQSIKN